MKSEKKVIYSSETQVRVRYGETDQMGYCYYGNYAQFFEVGRVETLRKLGMSYRGLEEMGYMLPVSTLNIKYVSPAFYDDLLTVTTKVLELSGSRLYFEYEIRNEENKVVVLGETMLVFVDKNTMRPTLPPKEFIDLFN